MKCEISKVYNIMLTKKLTNIYIYIYNRKSINLSNLRWIDELTILYYSIRYMWEYIDWDMQMWWNILLEITGERLLGFRKLLLKSVISHSHFFLFSAVFLHHHHLKGDGSCGSWIVVDWVSSTLSQKTQTSLSKNSNLSHQIRAFFANLSLWWRRCVGGLVVAVVAWGLWVVGFVVWVFAGL